MTREEKISQIYEVMWENSYTIECYNSCWCVMEVPVMIWDVLDWMYGNKKECDPVYIKSVTRWPNEMVGNNREFLITIWGEYRKPIEDQTDECIDFIYNLIKDD